MTKESEKDPIVKRKIGEKYLQMQASHRLPIYYDTFPFYDRALPRISSKLKEIDGYLNFVDVGANIGDTVSLVTDKVDGSFLCIEGDPKYLPFLKENIVGLKKSNIIIEESYCVEDDKQDKKLNIHRENGTARLEESVESNEQDNLKFKTLDTIIGEHPEFKKTNILKIDTDGFEIKVITGGSKFIKEAKSVIYFEFDPELYSFNSDNPESIFDLLYKNGYQDALIYDNFGIPIKIIKTSNNDDIKKLSDLIDKKKIYYFDVLTFHHSKTEHYRELFESELLSSLSLFDRILDSTKSQLGLAASELDSTKVKLDSKNIDLKETKIELVSTKGILDTTKSQLDTTKSQLDTTKSQLDTTKSQLDLRFNELNTIYYSRGWSFLMFLRKISGLIIPKESLRRRAVIFAYNFSKKCVLIILKIKGEILSLFLKIKNHFNTPGFYIRKINRKSKKIVYIGHPFHCKTGSTNFLIDYLKEFFEIEVVLDESWIGKPYPDLSFIDESYLGVIFFQLLPPGDIIKSIKNNNIICFPMYDNLGRKDYEYWSNFNKFKIINLSITLHNKLKKWGFQSIYVKYFPKPSEFFSGNKEEIFFWQRLTHININVISKLFARDKFKIHLHKAVDPYQDFIEPSKVMEKDFQISYSNWFKNKDEMLEIVRQKGIYVAPREYEGIGMSFLEAMAMGKAVIAVDNPTMNEYIKNGETGYLFDLKNVKKLDLSRIDEVQKNVYKYMQEGYRKWEKDKSLIINFIKQN